MNTQQNQFEDIKINVKIKLASLWASLMFFIIYLDYFHLYMPNSLKDILAGRVFVFEISQIFLVAAIAMVGLPALMIYLSVSLPAKINRLLNIIIATINIPLMMYNLAGEAWIHMYIGAAIEVFLLCLIIYYSWNWQRN